MELLRWKIKVYSEKEMFLSLKENVSIFPCCRCQLQSTEVNKVPDQATFFLIMKEMICVSYSSV